MDEKLEFSKRLLQALRQANLPANSPTRIALEFNLRYHGKAVTGQAVRKWIQGEAIPAQDKIKLLASWLGVSAEWLRFGETAAVVINGVQQETMPYGPVHRSLCNDIALLNHAHQQVVRALVDALFEAEKQPEAGDLKP